MAATQTAPVITFQTDDDKHQLHDKTLVLGFPSSQENQTRLTPRQGRINTNGSISEEDPNEPFFDPEDEKNHAQDWTIKTDVKDSWAVKERRRASVFGVHDQFDITSTSPKASKFVGVRRGSILSVWKSGKDKDGRDILVHDGSESDNERDGESELTKVNTRDSERRDSIGSKGSYKPERRGSILSMWAPGKDEFGRSVIFHDDDEWEK